MTYYSKLFWILTSATTVIRLFIIGKLGITVDEAHYWVYSKFLDLSYYDHPPMIAYIIKLSTEIFGINEFAVRFPSVVIFILTSWIFFLSAKKLFTEKIALTGVILLNILPVFSFLGAVVTIPDSPLSLFWMLSFYIFIMIIKTDQKKYWYIFGCVAGLALLAKYTAVMIFPSVFLFLLLSGKHRFWFKQKELYLSLIISFILFIPVILWNMENNWASFGFQLQHGFGKILPEFSFTLLGRSIGAQAGYISPLLFIFYCASLYICLKDAVIKKNQEALFVISFSLPVLLFFNAIATFNEILPHWPAMGYLVLTMYAAYLTCKLWDIKWFKYFTVISWTFAVIMNVIVPLHAMFQIIPVEKFLPKSEAEKVEYGISRAEIIDITNDLYGWHELSDKINEILTAYPPDRQPFIFTHKSYLASQIFFYVPGKRVYCLSDKIDAYDLWQRNIDDLNKKDAIFITSNFFDFKNPQDVFPFEKFEEPMELPIYRNGKISKKFWLTICKNFNIQQLPTQYSAQLLKDKKNYIDAFFDTDHALFNLINNDIKNIFLDKIISKISYSDSKGINPSFLIIIILSLAVLKKEQSKNFWILIALFASVLVCASIINYIIKDIVGRPRPLAFFGDGNINLFYEILHAKSFPSGHTQFAFTAAVFMLMIVPKYWFVYILWAFATGFERIYAGCHFPSDVAAGAIVGSLTAYIMVKIFQTRKLL